MQLITIAVALCLADGPPPDEITQLRAQLAAQRTEIEKLRVTIEAQQKLLDRLEPTLIASTTPVVPQTPAIPVPAIPVFPAQPKQTPLNEASPLSVKIGDTYLTPVGFVDVTYVGRTSNVGSGIGTNFAAIPFNNVPQDHLTDGYLSLQNSRIGLRFDALMGDTKLLAWWESDFLGNQPGNDLVSTNSNTFRMRLIWVDVRRKKLEFLGGQSWSLITPNRRGISPIPGDVFFSQAVDVNYIIGFPWGRVPTFRFVWHPTDKIAWAIAAENAQQYIGGSAGGGSPTLPVNLVTPLANQFNNGGTSYAVPSVNPDFISKLAFDPTPGGHLLHFEIAGMERTFRDYNPLNNQHYSTVGGAGSFNSNLELVSKGRFRLIENFIYGRGIGRWLFGQGPDLVVNSNGSIGLLPGYAATGGFESQAAKKLLLYGYYGVDYFGHGTVLDSNGKLVGYGYAGSGNTNNRTIQEGVFGLQYTFWRDPKWGFLRFDAQYDYLFRRPWFVAPLTARQAIESEVYINLRYGFPGEAPELKK
jgi:hypothetical protein